MSSTRLPRAPLWPRRCIAGLLAAVAVSAASVAADIVPGAAAGPSIAPPSVGGASPGARSLGDPFYPTLGNGGYDVQQYDLDLRWHPPDASHVDGWLRGRADIAIRTSQALSELSFDLTAANSDVQRVAIDGVVADHRPDPFGRKLLVVPGRELPAGDVAHVTVDWIATPMAINKLGEELSLTPVASPAATTRDLARGFLSDGDDGFFLAAQPDGAHTLFPSNDYPTDKAPVTIRLTAPPGMLGVASGQRRLQTANDDGSITTTWQSDHPVATQVLGIGVGRWSVIEAAPISGPHERSSVPTGLVGLAPGRLDVLGDAVAWLERTIGSAYPFDTLGVQMVGPGATKAILEGQTLILGDASMLGPGIPDCGWWRLVVHEVAHQWFGDSVGIQRWDEKWLSEGQATFYQRQWEAASGCDPLGLDVRMRAIYEGGQAARDAGGPPARPRAPRFAYDGTIYDQGALALYALRQRVGAATFEAIERAWLERFADSTASTEDFIAVASEVAGEDLRGFLVDWLEGDDLPPMPGHPSWTSNAPGPSMRPAAVPGASQ